MATYNCEKTIEKAIDSILAQSYENWTMIICDDGSQDDTLAILNRYAEEYPGRFFIVTNEKNSKLPYSLNHCLQHVQTELVARMDGDDWSAPDRFEKQVAFLKANPQYDLVGTGVVVSDGEKELTTIVLPEEPTPRDMLHCNCFSHASIMTYKRVYDALNGYSLEPYVERCEDLDLWSRFFAAGFRGYNMKDGLYYILEDENAAKRRTLRNRLNIAKTLTRSFDRMGIHGFACFKRAYLQILTYFVPMWLYKKLHVRKMTQRTIRYSEESEK